MRIPRFYIDAYLTPQAVIELSEKVYHHAVRVLRLHCESRLCLFNGRSCHEYHGNLIELGKKNAKVKIESCLAVDTESSRKIQLSMAIIKPDKMDFALQKATELGVYSIQPLLCQRNATVYKPSLWDKKRHHWHEILINACEQCGRVIPPALESSHAVCTVGDANPTPAKHHPATQFRKQPLSAAIANG